MIRGDIVTVVLPGAFGKPRPAVIVQADALNRTMATTIVCPFTSAPQDVSQVRVLVEPTPDNGLTKRSQIMLDKITVLPKDKVGAIVGRLEADHLEQLGRSLMIVLDLP